MASSERRFASIHHLRRSGRRLLGLSLSGLATAAGCPPRCRAAWSFSQTATSPVPAARPETGASKRAATTHAIFLAIVFVDLSVGTTGRDYDPAPGGVYRRWVAGCSRH